MKKILAILLALMMLTVAAASAENTVVISDPVVVLNMGEAQTIDLTGLEVFIAGDKVDDNVFARIDVKANGETVFGMDANVIGSKFVFTIDGVSNTYYADIPDQTADVTNLDISSLNIDFEALATTLMSSIEIDGDTIRIPYTAVNDLLAQLLPAFEGVEIPGIGSDQIKDAVSQLKESNSGITLEGTYSQDDGVIAVSGKIIPVTDGEAGEAALSVSFELGDSSVKLSADVPGQGSLYFNADMSGEDVIKVAFGGEAGGMGADVTGNVSVTDTDATFATLNADGAIDVTSLSEEDGQALLGEVMSAAGGLISYLYGALGIAA